MELFMSTVCKSIEEKKDKFIELVEIKNKLKPNGFIRLDKKVEKKLIQQKTCLEMEIPSSVIKTMEHWYELDHLLKQINKEVEFNDNKLKYHIEDMLSYLLKNEMIDESAQLTIKGRVVSEVNECNPLILGKIINSNILDDLEFNQIIPILSIFIADKCSSEIYISDLDATEKEKDALKIILQWKDELEKDEASLMNNIPFTFSSEWTTSLSMYEATKHWCNGNIWLEMKDTFDNFEGNYIKNIIRLGNLVRNILSIAKILNNIKLINKLDGYQEKLIRDIVITDSLYI
jgi:superfamily II RNA helicase